MIESISVLLPSRGRPESLLRALSSLRTSRAGVEIIVGLDEDDPKLEESRKSATEADLIITGPRQRTLHELFNVLYTHSSGEFVLCFPDDYVIENDWAPKVRDALKKLPKKLGVAYLNDPIYPEFTTKPVLSRDMVELNGFLMPAWHPFLFGDTWWNEIATLCGIKIQAQCVVRPQETVNDHSFKDLLIWVQMFERTRPMRTDTAIKITRSIFGDSKEADAIVSTMNGREEICRRYMAHQQAPEWLARWENIGAYNNPHYAELRSNADRFMKDTEKAA